MIEMRGAPGTTVEIGVKDNKQPDDGSETKVSVPLSSDYRTVHHTAFEVRWCERAAVVRNGGIRF